MDLKEIGIFRFRIETGGLFMNSVTLTILIPVLLISLNFFVSHSRKANRNTEFSHCQIIQFLTLQSLASRAVKCG
jgi:hypothetical protein